MASNQDKASYRAGEAKAHTEVTISADLLQVVAGAHAPFSVC